VIMPARRTALTQLEASDVDVASPRAPRPARPAPGNRWPALDWLQRNLFSSLGNSVLTLIVIAFLALVLPAFFRWAVSDATISGDTRSACVGDGACWTFIRMRLPFFFYGHYPPSEWWRVDLVGLLLIAFGIPVMRESTQRRGIALLLLLAVFPILAGILLVGDVPGLPYVDTNEWGGLMLDVIIAFVTVAGSRRRGSPGALPKDSMSRRNGSWIGRW